MKSNILELPKTSEPSTHNRGAISVEDASIVFGKGDGAHIAVAHCDLNIKPGEFVCLLGPSGCGKSTLLNAVAGFVNPTHGSVKVDGELITKPGPDRGMVFQQYSLFPWKTILENVAFGPKQQGATQVHAEQTAKTFIGMVGLSAYQYSYPEELSGGMKQRVGIARALANYPRVLLMDEPFGALDAQTRLIMQENLLEIWSEFKNTVLFVTHDVDEAVFLADRVIVMSASPGRIIADININLNRPRSPEVSTDPEFMRIKKDCLQFIRKETLRAFEQQNKKAS